MCAGVCKDVRDAKMCGGACVQVHSVVCRVRVQGVSVCGS